ncbi:VWA domain-containing protein [Raineyella fluvialis]|uniref:VWA domain-containing protein n=1 Tax=Raineyella fluvialis TaxID=2662261 RepID=A0A5Q2FDD0_9ACTN|nr:VWA domain-containing protein [Raineyella fluvialis]QGF24381.1 VWA domain-containing protein [Raineyella fluvialis]
MIPMIQFLSPGRLWWLLLVPLLLLVHLVVSGLAARGRGAHDPLLAAVRVERSWQVHLAVILAALSLVALTVAFARPKQDVLQPRERATIVVAIDVSLSMQADDVTPTRLGASKEAAMDFVRSLPPKFNVALVSFAGTATVVVPPTQDRGVVTSAIDGLRLQPSTAIGEGIYTALSALNQVPPDPEHPNDPPPARIVLLSDGFTTIGRPAAEAAQQARSQSVPIYSIAYGTLGGSIMIEGSRQPVPVDYNELATVARISGGKAYRATTANQLKEVYRDIGSSVGKVAVPVDVSNRYVGVAAAFALLASLGVVSLAARWP